MAFAESSEMIKVARINQKLLVSLWQGWKERHPILKLLLLLPVLLYSSVCLFFIVFFYVASIVDVIPYLISKIASALRSKAENLSSKNFGFFSMVFYPLFVFFLGILTLVVIILPKAIRIGDD